MSEGEFIGMASSHRIDKKCFHPSASRESCQGKIIRSHTVSKSSSLKDLSSNGKVLHFKPSVNSLFANNGRFSVEEVGINQASTFPGFCKKHDKEMFSPIEDKEFISNEYNSFLLGYRALTREIYAKKSAIDMIPKMRGADRGRTQSEQAFVQGMLNAYQQGSERGIRDLKYIKESYDHAFSNSNFTDSNYYIIRFSNLPNILYSGAIYPEYDFEGNLLQRLGTDVRLEGVSVNAITLPSGGCVVFQWMGHSDVNLKLIASLDKLDNASKASAVTQFAFESFENLFMRPAWWESLGANQSLLSERVLCGSTARNHTVSCFKPDGIDYYQWKDLEVDTNVKI